ncbi:MAG: capsular biosynthesis protein [Thiothrix nivea]|nr:MAG: capsular biosynthesis protein [Thiothrix nivea]
MSILLSALVITLLLATGSQYLLPASLRPRQPGLHQWKLLAASISSLYFTGLLLTQRPVLSAWLTLSILAVLLVVNQAKFRALREPLIFSDVYLYLQVVRHPRLFLPFLNIPLTLGALLAGLAFLSLAISLEPAITHWDVKLIYFYPACLLLLLVSLAATQILALQTPLSLDPGHDIQQHGFYNSLLSYTLQAASTTNRQLLQDTLCNHSPFTTGKTKPLRNSHLIVIQSESFFDARRLYPGISPNILKNFDQLKTTSLRHGQLKVPSWGANTLRPEFAFLSGINNNLLSYYRFNPYQYLQQPTPTLVSYLKQQGYYCIAIHPNSAGFFRRDKVFPLLGFDEFIDITDFNPAHTCGPYISDHAVQQKITAILEQYQDDSPLFIFVITMENHGPLHLETIHTDEAKSYYQHSLPKHHNDLSVYLRHLRHADQMLQDLTDYLQDYPRDTLLCFYGDHVPSMPKIYDTLGFSDGHTDYLIWHNQTPSGIKAGNERTLQTLSVDALAVELINFLQQNNE